MPKIFVRILTNILFAGIILGQANGESRQEILISTPRAADIPIIDAHSQVPFGPERLGQVVRLMDHGGIARIILSSKGPVTAAELVTFASNHPGRIVPAVRTKCRQYRENDIRGFEKFLQKQTHMQQFGAMAEILLYHARKGLGQERAPEVIVYPDDARVRTALLLAKKNRWPFVVHIEFKRAGRLRDTFMEKFETLLEGHSRHPFALMHMGQLDCGEVRQLIDSYKNLYFVTSHSTPIEASPIAMVKESEDPRSKMFEGTRLSPLWKQLMMEHPDRFILGFDNVWSEHWGEYYLRQIKIWRAVFEDLPQVVAHALAHRNAERLWNLPR